MRRLYALLVVMLLLSVVHMVAAQSLSTERKRNDESSSYATAVTERSSQHDATPSATIPAAPSITSSTPTVSTTVMVSMTDVLSSTQMFTATVIGYVREFGTDKPIANADVVVGGVAITSRQDGLFGPVEIPLHAASEDVDASATAPGYDRWVFKGVPLHDAKKLDIHIKLRPEGTAKAIVSSPRPLPSAVGAPPETIRLAITGRSECEIPSEGEYKVVEMPFADYLRNVLPNEWYASWPDASLDAGAVAVKQFAWYTAFIERKWSSQGYDFDLLDSTCDQHYVRNSYKPSTDAALQRTWALSLTRDGELFPTYYRALDSQCVRSNSEDCMGQWGTKADAEAGMSGIQILLEYYRDIVVEGLPRQNPVFLPLVVTS